MPTSPLRPRQTRDVPFSPNSITPTSPKLPRVEKFRGSRRNGICAKGDVSHIFVADLLRTSREVGIVEFGLYSAASAATHSGRQVTAHAHLGAPAGESLSATMCNLIDNLTCPEVVPTVRCRQPSVASFTTVLSVV